MHGAAPVERIMADAKAAFELVVGERRAERQGLEQLPQPVGKGVAPHRNIRLQSLGRYVGTALSGARRAEAGGQLIEIDANRREQAPEVAAAEGTVAGGR